MLQETHVYHVVCFYSESGRYYRRRWRELIRLRTRIFYVVRIPWEWIRYVLYQTNTTHERWNLNACTYRDTIYVRRLPFYIFSSVFSTSEEKKKQKKIYKRNVVEAYVTPGVAAALDDIYESVVKHNAEKERKKRDECRKIQITKGARQFLSQPSERVSRSVKWKQKSMHDFVNTK